MIRVFIADDQLLVRQGIRTLLEMDPEISVVGEAGDGNETIALVPTLVIDALLLDIRMPHQSGIEVLRELSAKKALPPTLILTTFDDSNIVLDGIRAGARGFMLKDVSYHQLIAAIRAVAGGATVFQPAVTERLLRLADMAAVPRPRVHLRVAETVRIVDPEGGHILFRCVQEILTNAARHSGAENLWIVVDQEGRSVRLRAHDDGRGG